LDYDANKLSNIVAKKNKELDCELRC